MSLANIYLESKVRSTHIKHWENAVEIVDGRRLTGIKKSYVLRVAPLCEDALLPIIHALYIVIVP